VYACMRVCVKLSSYQSMDNTSNDINVEQNKQVIHKERKEGEKKRAIVKDRE